MPAPTGERPAAKLVPVDLDRLFREAMAGGNLHKLKHALSSVQSVVPVGSTPERDLASPMGRDQRSGTVNPGAGVDGGPTMASPGAGPVTPATLFEDLGHYLHEARSAFLSGETTRARKQVQLIQARVAQLERSLAEQEQDELVAMEARIVELPAYRQPAVLVVEGRGEAERAVSLALALDVDNATARMIAAARHPKVALRSDDEGDLHVRAHRVRTLAHLRAVTVLREQLFAVEAPLCLLRRDPDGACFACPEPLWKAPPDQLPDGEPVGTVDVRLVVTGEIVVRRYRGDKKGANVRDAGEGRVRVMDLHGPGTFLRLAEGAARLDGFPGHVPGSVRRSMRALEQGAAEIWPLATVLAPRVCQPGDKPGLVPGADPAPSALVASGWPSWEEHTRLCRLLYAQDWPT